jgi:pimeloyl-ACP methyl ester carboxylesterase
MGHPRGVQSDTVELSPPHVTHTPISHSATPPEIDLSPILAPEAIAAMPAPCDRCMSHPPTEGDWSTAIARDQFVATPDLAPFLAPDLAVPARNEPGTPRIGAPALIIEGDRDTTVVPSATDRLAQQLCDGGNDLEYHIAAGADDGAMSEEGAKALAWLADRFAGRLITPNCADLPKARAD